MNPKNLPMIDARYWAAILAASMCGANTGDFASHILGLGHTRGLLPLALIFLAIVWAERRSTVATEAYYWFAIIVLRTGATNLADLGTHDLKLGYFLCMGLLAALMVAMLLIDHARGIEPASADPTGAGTRCRRPTRAIGSRCWPPARSERPLAIGLPKKPGSAPESDRSCSSPF
jgi:hypothetical protein